MATDEQPGGGFDPYPLLPQSAAAPPAGVGPGNYPPAAQPFGHPGMSFSSQSVLPQVRYASFGRRLLAYVIDITLVGMGVGILWFVGVILVLFTAGSNYLNSSSASGTVVLLLLGAVVVAVQLYFGLFPLSAATPGMRAVGLRLVSSSSGGRIRFWRSQARALFFTLNVLGFWSLLFLVDCLAMTWDSRHQAWHDKAGGAVLIQAEDPAAVQYWQPAGT